MYTYLTTVMYKEDSNAGAGVQADSTSNLYFSEIPMENNDRFNPMIKLNASDASVFSNVNYALIHWPDEIEPRRYFINYKRVTEENTIELGLNQDYLATFAAFINAQTALVTEATEPNSVVTVAETANIPVKSEIPVNEASETVELIPLSTPFIERTAGSHTASGVVIFGTSLQEVTNISEGPKDKDNNVIENFFKGFWTAEIANVHYYTVTMQSFVNLVNTINDKLLGLSNDKGKYDAFQQAISSVIYLPFDTDRFAGISGLQHVPRYIMPENYIRDDDGTVKYHDTSDNTDYTVKCHYEGNTIQMAERVGATYEALKIGPTGCVMSHEGETIAYILLVFKVPHVFGFDNDEISIDALMPYNLDFDGFDVNNPLGTIGIAEEGLGPYVAKLDFEAAISDSHFLSATYPRALNIEPYTTLKAHLGPFGEIDIPLSKVYEPDDNSTNAVSLSFTLCVDITTGDAILYVKASDGSVLAVLQSNIAQELAIGSVSNNGVTHLSLISKALGIMAGAPAAGAMATNRLNMPVNESDSALQSAAVFDPSLKRLAEMEAAAPLAAGGALVGALAGGVGAALSVLTTSQAVQRKYTKFSGWLSESARAFYFEIKRIMPMFNDPDIIPDLYPIFKSMTLNSWLGHKIKALLNKPEIPNNFEGLIPTKAELDVITQKLYSGVWLEVDTTPPLPEHYCTVIVPEGVTLQKYVQNSGVIISTVQGPATVYLDLSSNMEIATVQSTLLTSSDGWTNTIGGYDGDINWRFGSQLLTIGSEGDTFTLELPSSSTETFVYTLGDNVVMTALAEDSMANDVVLSAGANSLSYANYKFAGVGENAGPIYDVLNDVLIQPGNEFILPAANNSYLEAYSVTIGEDVDLTVDTGSGDPTTYSGPISVNVPYSATTTFSLSHGAKVNGAYTAPNTPFAMPQQNTTIVWEEEPVTVTWMLYRGSIGNTGGYQSEIYYTDDPTRARLSTGMEYTSNVGDSLTLVSRMSYGLFGYAKLYDSLNTLITEYTVGGYFTHADSVSFTIPANLACIVYSTELR